MRKRGRRQIRSMVAALGLAVAGAGGCATVFPPPPSPNPLSVPVADFETVWMACITSVDDYFDIASENRLQHKIITEPKVSATIFEPWYHDTVGFDDRFEATLQSMWRHAVITVNQTATGAFAVKVEVYKELEDMVRPEKQNNGRAVFNNIQTVNRSREVVGPVQIAPYWIPRGRDTKLEQAIIAKIREALIL